VPAGSTAVTFIAGRSRSTPRGKIDVCSQAVLLHAAYLRFRGLWIFTNLPVQTGARDRRLCTRRERGHDCADICAEDVRVHGPAVRCREQTGRCEQHCRRVRRQSCARWLHVALEQRTCLGHQHGFLSEDDFQSAKGFHSDRASCLSGQRLRRESARAREDGEGVNSTTDRPAADRLST
jgi:hypothetical protein